MKSRLWAVIAPALLILTACGDPAPSDPAPGGGRPAAEPAGPTVVFAAASLNQAFPKASAGQDISYSFDGSSGLVDQIVGGAPADVFASADRRNMDKAVDAGVIDGKPVMFATNHLVVVVPADNPAGVTGFDDSLAGVQLVVCAPEVPCGAATARAAESAELTLDPVSEESSVTDVLGKVTSGEADAGIVYATDATQAGDGVVQLDVPGAKEDPNTYWVAKVAGAPNPAGADAFIDLITGESGQQVLTEFGFGPPARN
ncbi:MAG: molybdate ABC transporter substrate-binding protein [Propionibacteriaceae bacterium]|nr:molybdate ABC transporter substrate-binding protein [Propionibacteriaceae bacterium]